MYHPYESENNCNQARFHFVELIICFISITSPENDPAFFTMRCMLTLTTPCLGFGSISLSGSYTCGRDFAASLSNMTLQNLLTFLKELKTETTWVGQSYLQQLRLAEMIFSRTSIGRSSYVHVRKRSCQSVQ